MDKKGVHVSEAGGLGRVDRELHTDEESPHAQLARPPTSVRPQEALDQGRHAAAVDPGDRLAKVSRPHQLASLSQQAGRFRTGAARHELEQIL